MASAGTAYVDVKPDLSRFGAGMSRSLNSRFKSVGLSAGKVLAGGIATAGAAGFAAVALEGRRAVKAFQESNKIARQTGAVLKSTGGAAGVTAAHVARLSTSLSRMSGIDDEAVQSGENLLLTFRDVRNEVGKGNNIFDQASSAALDMSVAMGTDMRSSALQLGKALQDPERGLLALRRSGVSFTKEQQDQIATLVKHGKKLQAQTMILAEVRKEFQGSARAQATSTAKMAVAIENLEEGIGRGLAPAVDAAANSITRFAQDAEPGLLRVSNRIGRIFNRKDLDLVGKIKVSSGEVRQALAPLVTEGQGIVKDMHLGDRLTKAFEDAAPRIVDALAAAAPHAAGAFVRAFKGAGPWGRLLTIGFIAAKLGAFSAAGNLAAGMFARRFRRSKAITAAAAAQGTRSGGAYAATFTATSSAGVAGAAKGGKFAGAATAIGRAMGPIAGALIAADIAHEVDSALRQWADPKNKKRGRIGSFSIPTPALIGAKLGAAVFGHEKPTFATPSPNHTEGAFGGPRRGTSRETILGRFPQLRDTFPGGGGGSGAPSARGRARRGANAAIKARRDTIEFQLEMGRITEGVAADQLDALAKMVKGNKALRRDLLTSAHGLREQADADAQQAADEARRSAAQARQRVRQQQARARSARQQARRAHRDAVKRARQRARSKDTGDNFELNLDTDVLPTVYQVRRNRPRGPVPTMRQQAQPTSVHNVFNIHGGDKSPKQIADEVVARLDHVHKTHGAASKRARAGRRG